MRRLNRVIIGIKEDSEEDGKKTVMDFMKVFGTRGWRWGTSIGYNWQGWLKAKTNKGQVVELGK